MCITCDVKVKGLHWLKEALFCERTDHQVFATYLLQQHCRRLESCDWIPLGFFSDNYENLLPNLILFFFYAFFFFLYSCVVKYWIEVLFLFFMLFTFFTLLTSNSKYATPPRLRLPLTGLLSVLLSGPFCGESGGNFKVLWKTKSGPAAAASCWPTLFRGSRYRLMTGLLLSGPHY